MKTALKIFLPILLIYGLYRLIMYTTSDLSSELKWVIVGTIIVLIISGIVMVIRYLFSNPTPPTTTPTSSTPTKSWLSGVRGGVIVISFLATIIILGLVCLFVVKSAWKVFTTKEETLTVQSSNATAFGLIKDHDYEFSVVETNGEVAIPDQKFIITDPIGYKKVQTGNKLPVRIAPFPPDGYVTPAGVCEVKLVNGNSAKIKLTLVPLTKEQKEKLKKMRHEKRKKNF